MRALPRLCVAVVIVAGVAPLPSAHAAGVEVSGAVLRVSLGAPQPSPGNNGAFVRPLAGRRRARVAPRNVNSSDKTVGPGCQAVANSNGGSMPASIPRRLAERRVHGHVHARQRAGARGPARQRLWFAGLGQHAEPADEGHEHQQHVTHRRSGWRQDHDRCRRRPHHRRGRARRDRRGRSALQGAGGARADRQHGARRPEPELRQRRRGERHLRAQRGARAATS